LPPGTYQLKFIVDDSWRCSKQIPTATDDDGTLVNWIEVEASKTEEEIKAEWAMDSKPAVKTEGSLQFCDGHQSDPTFTYQGGQPSSGGSFADSLRGVYLRVGRADENSRRRVSVDKHHPRPACRLSVH
jgi:hypothetical protein